MRFSSLSTGYDYAIFSFTIKQAHYFSLRKQRIPITRKTRAEEEA